MAQRFRLSQTKLQSAIDRRSGRTVQIINNLQNSLNFYLKLLGKAFSGVACLASNSSSVQCTPRNTGNVPSRYQKASVLSTATHPGILSWIFCPTTRLKKNSHSFFSNKLGLNPQRMCNPRVNLSYLNRAPPILLIVLRQRLLQANSIFFLLSSKLYSISKLFRNRLTNCAQLNLYMLLIFLVSDNSKNNQAP